MGERKEKKTPAQRLGEETAAAFAFQDADGEPIHSDNLGSYSGFALINKPYRTLQEMSFDREHLEPMYLGADGALRQSAEEEIEPTQDADDL